MNLKKILFAAMIFGTLACTTALAADPTVTLVPSAESVAVGEDFTVQIKIANNPGIINSSFEIEAVAGKDCITQTAMPQAGTSYAGTNGFDTNLSFSLKETADGDEGYVYNMGWLDMGGQTSTGVIKNFTTKNFTYATLSFRVPDDLKTSEIKDITLKISCLPATQNKNYETVNFVGDQITIAVTDFVGTASSGPAAAGNRVNADKTINVDAGEYYTFYTRAAMDLSNPDTEGAKFMIRYEDYDGNDPIEKPFALELPQDFTGVLKFKIIVMAKDSGMYYYKIVSADEATDLTDEQSYELYIE